MTAQFVSPVGACRDPNNSSGWWLADHTTIRYFDEARDELKLFAGSAHAGWSDGIGAAACFDLIRSILVSSDGQSLWCGQGSGGIRRVNLQTREVTTAGPQTVSSLVWDCGPGIPKDSAFYGWCGQPHETAERQIIRFDIASGAVKPYPATKSSLYAVGGLVPTPSGPLFSDGRSAVCLLDPITGHTSILVPLKPVPECVGFFVCSRRAYFVSMWGIATYTLPGVCFPLPKCCDRDF